MISRRFVKHPIRHVLPLACIAWVCVACAPITPLPGGGAPSSPPGLPSSGGSPGGSPSPSPGGTPSSPGGQSGGQPSSGGTPSGAPSGDLPGGQSGGESGAPPGGQPGGMPGGSDAEGESEPAEPTWEVEEGGGGAEGEGEWETSNEIPGGSEGGGAAGGGAEGGEDGEDGEQSDGTDASTDGQAGDSGDDELDGALKDFDGEILAEREILNAGGEGPSGAVEIPTDDAEAGAGGEQQTASSPVQKRSIPRAPAPPRRGSESTPDDIPDAKDDDIIARQLREAAMAELDPELQEKLWEEYRKYKKG